MVILVFYISYLTNEATNINADLKKKEWIFGLWGVVARIPAYTDDSLP